MAQQFVGQGPGNLVPDTETKMFLANGTVTKGDVVGLLVGALPMTGYTVDQCSATIQAIGVAAETGTDVWIKVVVSGFCDFVTNDGTDVVAGDYLLGAAGVAQPGTIAELESDASDIIQVFGQSLSEQTGTTCTEVLIFKRI